MLLKPIFASILFTPFFLSFAWGINSTVINDLANYPDFGKSQHDYQLDQVRVACLPKGMRVAPNSDLLFVAAMNHNCNEAGAPREATVSVIDITKQEFIQNIYTPFGSPGNVEVSFTPDGRNLLVVRMDGNGSERSPEVTQNGLVSVFDVETYSPVKFIPTKAKGSKVIEVSKFPDAQGRTFGYVSNWFSDNLTLVDLTQVNDPSVQTGEYDGVPVDFDAATTIKLQTEFPSPKSKRAIRGDKPLMRKIAPRGILFFGEEEKYALVLGFNSDTLIVLDAKNHKQIGEIPPIIESNPSTVSERYAHLYNGAFNFRHAVKDEESGRAYFSHMRRSGISRIDLNVLEIIVDESKSMHSTSFAFNRSIWNEIEIKWRFPNDRARRVKTVKQYPPADFSAESFQDGYHFRAEPNTIVLDPENPRFLYVSSRTTGANYPSQPTPSDQYGKVDVIDVAQGGRFVMTFAAGVEPTPLSISWDGKTLMSGGFRDNLIYFYDAEQLKMDYLAWLKREGLE